jgi:hypothetical protein
MRQELIVLVAAITVSIVPLSGLERNRRRVHADAASGSP